MNSNDPVREFLRERGSSPNLIDGGLAGLVESWEAVVSAVEEGYTLGLDDYLNDLDGRQLLEEALPIAADTQRQSFTKRVQQERLGSRRRAALCLVFGRCCPIS